jgi:hypothetical protein
VCVSGRSVQCNLLTGHHSAVLFSTYLRIRTFGRMRSDVAHIKYLASNSIIFLHFEIYYPAFTLPSLLKERGKRGRNGLRWPPGIQL